MRATRILNPELVREVLLELDDQVAEDNSPDPTNIPIDLMATPVIALSSGEAVHGIIAIQPFSTNARVLRIGIRPEYHGHKDNLELTRRGIMECSKITNTSKFLMTIPTEDKSLLRFAQQVGFKREGVMRNSFLRHGKMIDQYLVGVSV